VLPPDPVSRRVRRRRERLPRGGLGGAVNASSTEPCGCKRHHDGPRGARVRVGSSDRRGAVPHGR
jgi:hypothetical protein